MTIATGPPETATARVNPPIMGVLADRLRMTEGQLYTAILALLVAATLTLTGLPSAHRPDPTSPATPTTTVETATSVAP